MGRLQARASVAAAAVAVVLGAMAPLAGQQPERGQSREPQQDGGSFRFRSSVDLVNVTATVSDMSGRFVRGLRKEDFIVYEDGQPQEITHFDNERVPVSLGIAIDTSGSMAGDKIRYAREALDRFLHDLLDRNDEIFIYRFSEQPDLIEGWTINRERLRRALGYISPRGGTALYDTVAEAVPLAQSGQNRKKALLVISDGADTSSMTRPDELTRLVRESEVLVYAVGIQGQEDPTWSTGNRQPRFPTPRRPPPIPFPFPIPRQPPTNWPGYPPTGGGRGPVYTRNSEESNIDALRRLTDDSGGRTEVVRSARDLDPATASIADELSQQYYLGYPATRARDGRWHSIEVEVRNRDYRVRARRGYIATP